MILKKNLFQIRWHYVIFFLKKKNHIIFNQIKINQMLGMRLARIRRIRNFMYADGMGRWNSCGFFLKEKNAT